MNIPLGEWSGSNATEKLEKTIKDENRKKFIFDIIMLIVAVVAVGVSMKSCQVAEQAEINSDKAILISEGSNKIAKEANKISNDALETSQAQFLQINRPQINLNPKRFKNGWFWKVTQHENTVLISLQYEIKNVGNVAAKNITFPDQLAIGTKTRLQKDAEVVFRKLDNVTLGPGDDFVITFDILLQYENEKDAKANRDYLISDKSEGQTSLLSVNYTSVLDETQKYRTFMENRIHNDQAVILKSEMLILTENKEKI